MKKQSIKPKKEYFAPFNRFELTLSGQAVLDMSAGGRDADPYTIKWESKIKRPENCTEFALRDELREYGAWDGEELADDAANWRRILWLAAGNVKEHPLF